MATKQLITVLTATHCDFCQHKLREREPNQPLTRFKFTAARQDLIVCPPCHSALWDLWSQRVCAPQAATA